MDEKSGISRETSRETAVPYKLGPKLCLACGLTKPRIAFTKYGDGSYARRCYACKVDGKRAKPQKGGRA